MAYAVCLVRLEILDPYREAGLPSNQAEWNEYCTRICASRLQSPWGLHWRFEEGAARMERDNEDTVDILVRTCKQLFVQTVLAFVLG
jgi:hypothetical protein